MSRTSDRKYRRMREELKRQMLPCHWCGHAIDYLAPANHPDSFEADHLASLMSGGSNHGELVASHAHCNRSRGARERAESGSKPLEFVQVTSGIGRWL